MDVAVVAGGPIAGGWPAAVGPRSALVGVDAVVSALGGLPAPAASVLIALAAYYLVGTAVLGAWPDFSRTVTRTVVRRPVRSLVFGVLLMLAVSALSVAAYTALSIAGPFLVFAFVWLPIALLAVVYVSVAVTGGLLSLLGVDRPYLALTLGGVAPVALVLTPRDAVLDLLFLAVLTFGGGAMLWSLWHRRRSSVK